MIILEECGVGLGIIEYQADFAKLLTLFCKKHDIKLSFIAPDGMSAIPKLSNMRPRPRIMIVDHALPVMDGLEVTKEILRIEPEAKVILLADDNDMIRDAKKAGAFIVLVKPVSMYHLLRTIEGIVETYSNIKIR